MNSRPKRLMKFLKDNIGYCVYTFMVDKDLKKTHKKQTIKINTANFNYIKIMLSQNFWNFCFEQTKNTKQNQFKKCEMIN